MKSAQDYMAEANEVVPKMSAEDAIKQSASESLVFVDVRDSSSIAETGTIAGALRVPRGMIEFVGDESMPMHNAALKKDAKLMLVCGAGGQAALAGKTLLEMGYQSVTNIGGIGDWKDAGGEMES